ncbi:head-tail connector protein [Martelella alba]|uniref:Phage gp6-like head-tail connector protein n=1 Tax=Martelella alba TaxID=2590451 RepID=A0ABY2SDV0_9HYPH|nr:head-tail connector protein [Martelella alba]TKI02767.1 phage gp6-like head-tail connector protein [Martelella alba]
MLTADKVKEHCNIESEFTEDDAWIDARIKAAAQYVENYTDRKLYDDATSADYLADPTLLLCDESIETAMLLLVGHWYTNREAVIIGTNNASSPLDFGVNALLQPYRRYGV